MREDQSVAGGHWRRVGFGQVARRGPAQSQVDQQKADRAREASGGALDGGGLWRGPTLDSFIFCVWGGSGGVQCATWQWTNTAMLGSLRLATRWWACGGMATTRRWRLRSRFESLEVIIGVRMDGSRACEVVVDRAGAVLGTLRLATEVGGWLVAGRDSSCVGVDGSAPLATWRWAELAVFGPLRGAERWWSVGGVGRGSTFGVLPALLNLL